VINQLNRETVINHPNQPTITIARNHTKQSTLTPTNQTTHLYTQGVSGSFTVLSGHWPPEDPRAESWHSLPVLSNAAASIDDSEADKDDETKNKGAGTLVVLMGTKQLPNIARYLIDTKGWRAATPVVVVESATTDAQTVVRGTLRDIAERVAEANVKPPSTIVIGEDPWHEHLFRL
jgi:siroheme synthase